MNLFGFTARSFLGSRRTAIPLLLLGAITTAVITGAVLSGDFVRRTLAVIAEERLGKAQFVLDSPSRFISAHLLEGISLAMPEAEISSCILATGSAAAGDLRITGIQVVGIDESFFSLSPAGDGEEPLLPAAAYVNRRLAAALSLKAGDGIVLSVAKANSMPLDAPLAGSDPGAAILSLNVQAVVDDANWGRFNLRSEQRSPATIFVDRDRLARAIGRSGKINLVLAAPSAGAEAAVTLDALNMVLEDAWDIRWAGFTFATYGRYTVLASERVFMEREVVDALDSSNTGGEPVLGYFLDSVSARSWTGETVTSPYAFAAGMEPDLLSGIRITGSEGSTRQTSGVVITSWLAEDLNVGVGDTLTLSFRIPTSEGLLRKTAEERIAAVVNVPASAEARALMPEFPGMTAAETCTEWDPGIPLDLSKIRSKDERYWYSYKGTPKIFLSQAEGQRLWANAYGDRTAYFFRNSDPDALAGRLAVILGPQTLGVSFKNAAVYGQATEAGPLDFGALFLGLSLFLIASSLILTGLVFSLHVAFKEKETGLLLALGHGQPAVWFIRLLEGGMAALVSAAAGSVLGILYSLLVVAALNGAWSDAVSGGGISIAISAGSLGISAAAGLAASFAAMTAAVAGRMIRSPMSLLTGAARGSEIRSESRGEISTKRRSKPRAKPRGRMAILRARVRMKLRLDRRPWLVPVCAGGLFVVTAAGFAVWPGLAGSSVMGFFISGAATLAGLLIGESILLSLLARKPRTDTMPALALRNAAFRRRRTIASSVIIASGLFVIASVGANPWLARPNAEGRDSGSGGFSYFVQTSRPFRPEDIRSRLGSEYAVTTAKFRTGDDASCLNLARSMKPPLVGVMPEAFQGRFSFSALAPGIDASNPWKALESAAPYGGIYAFTDSLSLEWNLGLSIGDSIPMEDEFGKPFLLVIAGAMQPSVFQGSMVISEDAFRGLFPSVSGKSIALVEGSGAASSGAEGFSAVSNAFRSFGAEVEGSMQRLESFARVQYAYLSIFLFLGATGLLFGMTGFAVMTARNVREEAAGRALLRAFGFVRWKIVLLSVVEQSIPLFMGLIAGFAASSIALLPLAGSGVFPAGTLALITIGAAAVGLGCTAAASLPIPAPEKRALFEI